MTDDAVRDTPQGTPRVIALFGATGLGKTDVAVALAERLGAETVVADSMQVYRGLPILTNQPTAEQRARGRYRLVGVLDPSLESSVAAYAALAHAAIDDALGRGVPVIVEGGSGLYLRAALGSLTFAGKPDPLVRRDLEASWARDPAGVAGELRSLDPGTAARLDLANPRRVIRALEAVRALGRPLTEAERGGLWRPAERYAHLLVALEPSPGHAARAHRHPCRRDGRGGRARRSPARPFAGPLSRTVQQAIGVRELLAVLDGECSLEEAVARMRSRTHAFVRRQLTWSRKLPAAMIEPVEERAPDQVAAAILARLREG